MLIATLVACGAEMGSDDETTGMLVAQGVEDSLTVAETTAPASNERTASCVDTWGDCAICTTVDGVAKGTITIELADACTSTVTGPDGRSFSYAVDEVSFAGTYEIGADSETVTLSGDRRATVTLDGDASYDATFTLTDLSVEVIDDAVDNGSVSLAYDGLLGGGWTAEATLADGVLTGTASGPRGGTCTLEGSADDVSASCDGVR